MSYAVTQTTIPNTKFTGQVNNSAPVTVQELGILIDVVLSVKGTRILFPDPVTGAKTADAAVPLAASTEFSGGLVIKAYENEIKRAQTSGSSARPTPLAASELTANSTVYPAGLYIESGQKNVQAQYVMPYSTIQQRINSGGVLRVFVAPPTVKTPTTRASTLLYRNGVLQPLSVTATVVDGATWAWYEIPAQPASV